MEETVHEETETVVEEKVEEPLEKAVAGPVLLGFLTVLWGGLAIWGLSIGAWTPGFGLLGGALIAALCCGAWIRHDRDAWIEYRAYKEREEADLYE